MKQKHDTEKQRETRHRSTLHAACSLLGAGGCRGDGWADKDKDWPRVADKGKDRTAGQCCQACAKTKGCTAFHLSDEEDDGKGACVLFGHKDVVPAKALGGKCYTINRKKGEILNVHTCFED